MFLKYSGDGASFALIKDSSNYEELKKKDDEHVIDVLKTFGITVNFMN